MLRSGQQKARNGASHRGATARFVKNSKTTTSAFRGDFTGAVGIENKLDLVRKVDAIDTTMGFDRLEHLDEPKKGWLVNMHPTTLPNDLYAGGLAGVDYYFLDEEGGLFKVTVNYDPYFFVVTTPGHESEVEEWLRKQLEEFNLKLLERTVKEDLSLPNHLVGLKQTLLKLKFHNISDLLAARRVIMPVVKENLLQQDTKTMYDFGNGDATRLSDPLAYITDIREYDVPYHVRVLIDCGIHVGKWYNVYAHQGHIRLEEDKETLAFADPVVLAFDIETTKAPLKFPDLKIDQVMMISYMIDGEGFLITNREVISEDIEDFEYTPKPEYPGNFVIFNEANEKAVLERFFEHIRDVRPTVIATFNGDFFDWPFVDARAKYHDLDMFAEIGFAIDNEGEYKLSYCVHMDCYRWVKRDSYLPQGSQGLKAVTTAKLGYNPTELDPELMTPYAYDHPQLLAEYSVSDAVATFYLYSKYVHPFIFSLCTILPLNPDEVLRKGTGTLCEMLLSVKAYEKNIVLPNKHADPVERFFEGHLIELETYVGGHVESLEAGVFRHDIPCKFNIDPLACDEVIGDLHNSIKFCIEVENGKKVEDVTNYDDVYNQIRLALEGLKNEPTREENPLIYHVDVASMYPNIMTLNRLQPDSLKLEKDCATCDFNRPGKTCDRRLPWLWRGEYYPAEMNEYNMIKRTLQNEQFPPLRPHLPPRRFEDLSYPEQALAIKKRVSDYSRKVYNRIKQTKVVTREALICQRENPFYVDTVRLFRDRRYDFKGLTKVWKGKLSQRSDPIEKDEAKKMIVLYDSLQLAHKVILNSFYGYVMRKGLRWYLMEMAGVTCLTGAHIIQMARKLVERLGRPLELDTDGIWCILPKLFPENFKLNLSNGKLITLEFPCLMLNYLVHQKFTNHQYQTLVDPQKFLYETHSDNSIFFEVDGPYRAMILPTSKEEGKGLKKRYAVFNMDRLLAELKGFELKRRGELRLIKNFQLDIFKLFLEGETLETCYAAVASVANNWLDVLDTKGGMLEDEDLIELICENRLMSKPLREYGNQKLTSITTAKRLGEFLGEEMVQDAGLATKYIISAKPLGTPVTERAIPVAIFSLDKKQLYLRKWLRDPLLTQFGPRDVIDWDYYRERLALVIQKIITIPAALQGVDNPVPRVAHPDWLQRRIAQRDDSKQQLLILDFFGKQLKEQANIKDIEDFGKEDAAPKVSVKVTSRKRKQVEAAAVAEADEEVLKGSCPDPTVDYAQFLVYEKAKWRAQSGARDRRNRLFGPSSELVTRLTVGDIFRRQAELIVGNNWEILEFKRDPQVPGAVKAFVVALGKIHGFTFHIPRQLYASYKMDLPQRRIDAVQGDMEPLAAMLPHGGNLDHHLYKLVTLELNYQDLKRDGNSVLNDQTLLGIYELHVTPVQRAVMDLGNTVVFDETRVGALGRAMKQGFNQKLLRPVELDNYLQRFSPDITFVLHLVVNLYHFFCVFKLWEPEADVLVLKPLALAQELTVKLDRVYAEIREAKSPQLAAYDRVIDFPKDMKFTTQYYSNSAKLYKKLGKLVAQISEGRPLKPLFAVQLPQPLDLMRQVSALNDLPCVQMTTRELSVGAVGWHSLIAKRIVNHYLLLALWLANLTKLCRYARVPLCNVHMENLGYLVDVDYCRRLKSQNMVLWWLPGPLPDLGGQENDTGGEADDKFALFPEINTPEVYQTACLEIEIGTLTINAILASALIADAEGVEVSNQDGASASYTQSLATLRNMVKELWDNALQGDASADSIMNALVLWVQLPQLYMYDSALHYHVHNLTSKCLLQLAAEFKRMQCQVVFANRNRLVVSTTKVLVENSFAFGQYMTKLIQLRPMFHFLELAVTKYWDVLVWMDQYNFCGRYTKEIVLEDHQPLEVVSAWGIHEYLPKIYRDEFVDWTIIFLDALVKQKHTEIATSQNRVTQIGHRTKPKEDDEEEDPQNGVMETFRKPLEKRIKKLYKQQTDNILNPEFASEYKFPHLPGSHLTLTNPTLELVNYLMAVFGLSKKRELEVRLVRKDLLHVFGVKEFSKQAEFVYPSALLVVGHFICDYCNFIRDIDVCREPEERVWSCSRCSKPYNRVALEERLIAHLQKLIIQFYQQDYKCDKCKLIRRTNLSLHCKCLGNWVETFSYDDLQKRILVMANVGNFYKLKILEEAVEL